MWTVEFWKDVAERAIKTFAQVAATFLVLGTTGVADVDWVLVVSVAGVSALVSVLTSVASEGVGTPGNASVLTRKE